MSERLKRSIVKGFAAGCVNLCVVVPVGQVGERSGDDELD